MHLYTTTVELLGGKKLTGQTQNYGTWTPNQYRALFFTPSQIIVETWDGKTHSKPLNPAIIQNPQKLKELKKGFLEALTHKNFFTLEEIFIDNTLLAYAGKGNIYQRIGLNEIPRNRLTAIYAGQTPQGLHQTIQNRTKKTGRPTQYLCSNPNLIFTRPPQIPLAVTLSPNHYQSDVIGGPLHKKLTENQIAPVPNSVLTKNTHRAVMFLANTFGHELIRQKLGRNLTKSGIQGDVFTLLHTPNKPARPLLPLGVFEQIPALNNLRNARVDWCEIEEKNKEIKDILLIAEYLDQCQQVKELINNDPRLIGMRCLVQPPSFPVRKVFSKTAEKLQVNRSWENGVCPKENFMKLLKTQPCELAMTANSSEIKDLAETISAMLNALPGTKAQMVGYLLRAGKKVEGLTEEMVTEPLVKTILKKGKYFDQTENTISFEEAKNTNDFLTAPVLFPNRFYELLAKQFQVNIQGLTQIETRQKLINFAKKEGKK